MKVFRKNSVLLFFLVCISSEGYFQEAFFVLPSSNQAVVSPATIMQKEEKLKLKTYFRKNSESMLSPQSNYFFKTSIRLKKNGTGIILNASAFKSVQGQTEFGVARYVISLADQIQINANLTTSFGISGNWNSLAINRDNLVWEDQFDENSFQVNSVSDENLGFMSRSYLDFSTGVSLQWRTKKIALIKSNYLRNEKSTTLGISINHFGKMGYKQVNSLMYLKPQINVFFENTGLTTNGKIFWTPQLFCHYQSGFLKINAGGYANYSFKSKGSSQHIYLGAGMFYTSRNMLTLVLRVNFSQITAQLSYDIRLNDYRDVQSTHPGLGLHFDYLF